jgi:hypothetical protein
VALIEWSRKKERKKQREHEIHNGSPRMEQKETNKQREHEIHGMVAALMGVRCWMEAASYILNEEKQNLVELYLLSLITLIKLIPTTSYISTYKSSPSFSNNYLHHLPLIVMLSH